MAALKRVAAALAAVLTIGGFSVSAEANHRCGYDPYGYRAPDFSGCYRHHRVGWGFYPAYGFYPEGSYYATPRYPAYAVYPVPAPYYVVAEPRCYYDYGWYRVRRICY